MATPSSTLSASGLPLSFNQFTARDLSLATVARTARGCGFGGIGVLPSTVAALGTGGVRSVLDGEGLRPTSVCALVDLIGADPDATGRCVDYAAELDVPLVAVVGGPGAGLTRQDAWQRAVAAVDALFERARSAGGTVLVEPLHPALIGESVATSVGDGIALIQGHDAAGLVVDTWHVWWDRRLRQELHRAGGRIGIVHLADWAAEPAGSLDRVLPGGGVADLPTICAELIDVGFEGWWEVEVLSATLWAGDQEALVRASYDAAVAVLDRALARTGGLPDEREAAW